MEEDCHDFPPQSLIKESSLIFRLLIEYGELAARMYSPAILHVLSFQECPEVNTS